ncbi:LysR substrate-binding domain-containing protein [Kushneria marisflavi]|uniref:LysR family transcriptional regulator n=1 Tax=Kushneria marisflavi TaxID=157779 RepID=A0A240USY5_9GAMM|nr:LysR substrate-binding domain-containing protein [Kushneria marisflavi]ART64594.1 LysR family transcriptional regulator [Kushneria marisflavi]RKD84075.1 LysR family transcriptional regulator [Kushneria marisflavi]
MSSRHALPPLNCLRAFEAAARLASITRASHELALTQSAVSRQIQRLESDLGKPLFERQMTGLALTEIGKRYYHLVQRILRELGDASADIRRRPSEQSLTIASSPTIASFWLSRQLSGFQARYPDISIRMLIIEDPNRLEPGECDLGIYYHLQGEVDPVGMTAETIFDHEQVAVLCSPTYLAREGRPADVIELLEHHVLMVVEDHYHDWLTWQCWCETLGAVWQTPARMLSANSYQLLMNATLAGQGVTLGWTRLLAHELEQGLLVEALDTRIDSRGRLSLLMPGQARSVPAAQLFRQWLMEQNADTLMSVES